jgi:hypothetical protein
MIDPNDVYEDPIAALSRDDDEPPVDAPRVYGTKEQALAADDIVIEDVFVKPWNAWYRVRSLTAAQRGAWQRSCLVGRGKDQEVNLQESTARLVAWAVVDENGKPIFSEADILKLKKKSSVAIELIGEVAARLSGIGEKEMDDITGKSRTTRNDDLLIS